MKVFAATAATAAVASAMALAGAAQAAVIVNFDGNNGSFRDDAVTESPFERTFTVTVGQGGALALNIGNSRTSDANNIDFTSVTLNGVEFNVVSTGVFDQRNILQNVMAGVQTIVVKGTSGGDASFAGTVAFTPGVVPEPATWGMMIGGFGLAGFALRRRRTLATA